MEMFSKRMRFARELVLDMYSACSTETAVPNFSAGEDAHGDDFDEALAVGTRLPVIGVMAQLKTGTDWVTIEKSPDGTVTEFIAASYVKFVESAAARVVPVSSLSSKEELTRLFSKLNGLLVPGKLETRSHVLTVHRKP